MSSNHRSLAMRAGGFLPWLATLLLLAVYLGWFLPTYSQSSEHEPPWHDFARQHTWIASAAFVLLVIGSPVWIATLNIAAYLIAGFLSPWPGHGVTDLPTWLRPARTGAWGPLGKNIAANVVVWIATLTTSKYFAIDLALLFRAEACILLLVHVGIAGSFWIAGIQRLGVQSREDALRRAQDDANDLLRQEQRIQQERADALRRSQDRNLRFEEMRRELTQLYLRHVQVLDKTHWTADLIQDIFRGFEDCYQERWDEVARAFEAYRYDLQLHAEVWTVAKAYERVSPMIEGTLTREHLWQLLRGIQRTNDRAKPIEKVHQECVQVAESLHELCAQSRPNWLIRHDDATAQRYEAILGLPIPDRPDPAEDAPTRKPTVLPDRSSPSLIPRCTVVSDA